jgi:FtsZ-interacting cell division protein ZipA
MAVRITQSGVALTVGIIILTALIIGGLFWVKQTGEQARRDEAVKIAEEKLESQSSDDVALNEGEEAEKNETERSNGETASPSEENAETIPGSEATPNESSSDTQPSDELAQTGTDVPEETVAELPETGLADTGAVLVLGATTFAAVTYYRSRRSILESL